MQTEQIDEAILAHAKIILSWGRTPQPQQGSTQDHRGMHTRIGRAADGSWYGIAAWPVMEGHDDDYESTTCRIKEYIGRPHEAREHTAATLTDLIAQIVDELYD